ncbi:MAG: dephospho-CoA kinase [Thermoprotei archaeon]|nr:MAG: dephospho-CoA kinase [Thermoprotei archaeon]
MPGSGKSILAEAARMLGIPVVSMGDAVRGEAKRRGLDLTPRTLAQLSLQLRESGGPAAIAELTLKHLPRGDIILIEGVRSLDEVERFKECFNRVVIVAVHSSPRTRFRRLLARRREDDPSSWEEFVERDRRELRFGLGEVIALSDYMLVNEDVSKRDFLHRCLELLRRLVSRELALE